MQQKIYQQNHQLDEFFQEEYIIFNEEDKKAKSMRNFKEHAVVTNNISGLIDKVLVERGLNKDDVLIRVWLDGEGEFLKVCI